MIKMDYSYINELNEILDNNTDKRICVVGTTCTGKTTFLKEMKNGVDMDEIIFKLLTDEEKEYVCQTPWTEDIGNTMDRLVRERIKIQKGVPVFSTVIIDCDLIVYLKISDELLQKRTKLRNVDFKDAKNMQVKIEQELNNALTPVIVVNVK